MKVKERLILETVLGTSFTFTLLLLPVKFKQFYF